MYCPVLPLECDRLYTPDVTGLRHILIHVLWLFNSALNPGRFCYRCKHRYYCCGSHGCSNPYCEDPCVSFELRSAFIQTQGAGGGVWLYIVLLHVHVQHRRSTRRKRKTDQRGKKERPNPFQGLSNTSLNLVLCLNINRYVIQNTWVVIYYLSTDAMKQFISGKCAYERCSYVWVHLSISLSLSLSLSLSVCIYVLCIHIYRCNQIKRVAI